MRFSMATLASPLAFFFNSAVARTRWAAVKGLAAEAEGFIVVEGLEVDEVVAADVMVFCLA